MNSVLDTPAFLFIWMSFPLLMCGALIVFFLWGVRSGQFADQERARYLALDSGIPGPEPMQKIFPPPGGGDCATRNDSTVPAPGGGGSERKKVFRKGNSHRGQPC